MTDNVEILIIDDNQDDRENYIRALKKISVVNYRCFEAQDGGQGLDLILTNPYGCILLDYSLPGMNGLGILRRIRLQNPYLPVILLTGQGNEAVAVEAIKEGASDYITKASLNSERLHSAITAAIEQASLKRDNLEKDKKIREKTQALELSEERYELVVQGLSVGIWDWNIMTNRIYSSPRFKEMLQFSNDETEGHFALWESQLHPQDHARVMEALESHLKREGVYDVEYRFLTENKDHLWIRAKGQATWDDHGVPVRMVGSLEDITWRKEAEVERERMIAKLIESNSDLERFAYVCSHDLQEPLRMISSFIQLLQKHLGDQLDERGLHYMKYITDASAQSRLLISDVLNYARVDHEEELLTYVGVDAVFKTVVHDLKARIQETKAVITHDALPFVYMQSVHLRQVLQNLIGNALKFCKVAPHIHVGAVKHAGYWHFSVRDNGIGIPQEHMDKIFVIFQRLHCRDRYPGTGIGLALCKKIVQKYGGKIWAESKADVGSTFHFSLPSVTVQEESEAA